jgi:hypothetical protein
LISTTIGQEESVRKELLKIKEVKRADTTSGAFDNVAMLEGESVDELIDVIMDKIRKIPSIVKTESLVAKTEAEEEKFPEETKKATTVYKHGKYALYTRDVELKGGKVQTIYFFSKRPPRSGTTCDLPRGYEVGVNKRTGLPYLKKA